MAEKYLYALDSSQYYLGVEQLYDGRIFVKGYLLALRNCENFKLIIITKPVGDN